MRFRYLSLIMIVGFVGIILSSTIWKVLELFIISLGTFLIGTLLLMEWASNCSQSEKKLPLGENNGN